MMQLRNVEIEGLEGVTVMGNYELEGMEEVPASRGSVKEDQEDEKGEGLYPQTPIRKVTAERHGWRYY